MEESDKEAYEYLALIREKNGADAMQLPGLGYGQILNSFTIFLDNNFSFRAPKSRQKTNNVEFCLKKAECLLDSLSASSLTIRKL